MTYVTIWKYNKPPFDNKNLYSNSKVGISLVYMPSYFFQLQYISTTLNLRLL